MVSLGALWLPIVVSSVAVFVGSSVIHMVLKYHRSDYRKLPGEDNILAAMRNEGVGRGHYYFPHCLDPKEMNTPEAKERFDQGPVGFMSVLPNGLPNMGKGLVQWFVYSLVASVFVAYVCSRTLQAGTDYLAVFRIAGTVAFLTYGGGQAQQSIWKGEPWSLTAKFLLDSLIYALLTAGVFGWLWP